MKKYIYSIVVLIGVWAGLSEALAAKKTPIGQEAFGLEIAITSGHTKAFSKEGLITESISNDIASWQEAVNSLGLFVKKYNKDLEPVFKKITDINTQLENALKVTFNSYIKPLLIPSKKEKGSSLFEPSSFNRPAQKVQLNKIYTVLDPLQGKQEELKDIIKNLTALSSKFNPWQLASSKNKREGANEALRLIIKLANILEITIAKVFNDLKRFESFLEQQAR